MKFGNKTMSELILQNVLDEAKQSFDGYKKLAERAFEQVCDEEFFALIDAESNSMAIVAKHVGGNLRSRWRDFLTSDGEKADRDRDGEFVAETDSRDLIMRIWEAGWSVLFETLESLQTEDLGKTVQIRGEAFTVIRALNRSLTHTAYHVGQIVFLAKHLRESNWKTLSVPKNQSAQFTAWLESKDEKGDYLEATQEFTKENLK